MCITSFTSSNYPIPQFSLLEQTPRQHKDHNRSPI